MAGLGDLLAGIGGNGPNRPALDAFVANSQANNAYRNAQTDQAFATARKTSDEAQAQEDQRTARNSLSSKYTKMGLDPDLAEVAAGATIAAGPNANPEQIVGAALQVQKLRAGNTLGDPSQIGTPAATAAGQVMSGKPATAEPLSPNFQVPAGLPPPNQGQTPLAAAQTNLVTQQATHPQLFHPSLNGMMADGLPPELQQAVSEGRLDPARLNSRNIAIYSQLAKGDPAFNFNQQHADASLNANNAFRQKAMTIEALPTLMSHMTQLGKALDNGSGYSNVATVGKIQKWMNGEFNDPAYSEYMSVRNDVLLNIASAMRGVGMSDQAHTAETEVASPVLSPLALDGWLKGQMAALQPRLQETQHVTHIGQPGFSRTSLPPPAPPSAAATGAPAGGSPTTPIDATDPFGLLGH